MTDSPSRKKISLLLICQTYPPGAIAGSELEAQRVCSALIKRGYDVKVVCAGVAPMPDVRDWVDPQGVPVRMYARHWTGKMKDLMFALRVGTLLIRERRSYDTVYFLMQGLHLAVGLPIARLLGKPILMKISSSIIIPKLREGKTGRLELRWLRKWAKSVMILNEDVRQQALAAGFSATQLVWMPNPVDTNEFSSATSEERSALRSKLGLPFSVPIVLYCGRLFPVKALPSLLRAFAVVVRKCPEALLILLGEGPCESELKEETARLELQDNIRFMGRIEPQDVPHWLRIADVFTLVSFSEGFSCALTEAMSAGIPSVVSDIPANRQLIQTGEQGLLAPAGDSGAIAAAILCLLQNPALREQMGMRARRTILDNYSIDLVTDRYESLILEAIK